MELLEKVEFQHLYTGVGRGQSRYRCVDCTLNLQGCSVNSGASGVLSLWRCGHLNASRPCASVLPSQRHDATHLNRVGVVLDLV